MTEFAAVLSMLEVGAAVSRVNEDNIIIQSENISYTQETYDCCLPEYTEKSDIIAVSVPEGFKCAFSVYGNTVMLEELSTDDVIYFRAVSCGKDSIFVSSSGCDGMVITEYAVIINENLTASVYPVG